MSRIDEALRRNQLPADASPATAVPRQQLFAPAWPVTEPQSGATSRAPAGVGGAERRSHGLIAFASAWRERLATGSEADPGLVEQFRRLAATLHQAKQTHGLKSVMVTSAAPGDGKTLTAVNLALVLAESYRSTVLLIDADLRRPSIPSVVDLADGSGLSEALRSPTEQKLALMPITERLTLLPAGQPIANSIEALTSPRMQLILAEAVARYDWVVLDAPPVGPTTDARLLTALVGGTLFVIHAGKTQHADVQKAIDTLGREHILGVVLNGVQPSPADSYYYGERRMDPKG